jgi:hypothetical protein
LTYEQLVKDATFVEERVNNERKVKNGIAERAKDASNPRRLPTPVSILIKVPSTFLWIILDSAQL